MAAESHTADICAVLSIVIRAMVDHPDDVAVTHLPEGKSILIKVKVAPTDAGKVIGKQGRTARSLRIILASIAKTQGEMYALDIDGQRGLTDLR